MITCMFVHTHQNGLLYRLSIDHGKIKQDNILTFTMMVARPHILMQLNKFNTNLCIASSRMKTVWI